ncbi:hypothetical protein AVEN_160024-1 [Araneus ventricosus]|uniref:Endonuclease/exonuclease/phosphatase domain-containing protein n=1 Tax=Araneus ventricosus TaxID=182803 RepID=A0A4Y2NHL0_ARAVE|nr:hypothetical protein AVEN_160024-1 [Araneus ventricosus]
MRSPYSALASMRLKVLQWNAGGLSQSKKVQIQQTLLEYNIDLFAIMKANLTEDSVKFSDVGLFKDLRRHRGIGKRESFWNDFGLLSLLHVLL